MNMLLQQLTMSTMLLLPLAYGLAVFALLLGIYFWLNRLHPLRGVALPYVVGALTLGAGVGLRAALDRLGLALASGLRGTLLVILALCWTLVAIGLGERLLIDRWMSRQGVSVPRLARDIARAVLFILAVVLTIRFVFDVPLSSIVISSTVLTAVIGFALQDLLKNVIAGIALQMERPFDVGHWVEINKQIGRVVEMSWRATRVITIDGNYIIYPNSILAQSELINYTLGSPVQALHVQLGIAPHHPPNLVKRVLQEAALVSPDICREPAPSIKVQQFGSDVVTYDVKFWLYEFDRYSDKRDAVLTQCWYALNRAGIKLPIPLRQVYMHEVDPSSQQGERRVQIARVVNDLRRIDIFAVLDEQELLALAEHSEVLLYSAGEVLARQGQPGDTFFVIRSGRVRVDVDDGHVNGRAAVTVNHLGPGDFFGELALLTGEPRGATVVAEVDTETLVVDRSDLAPLLQQNHELPERLGAVLARRLEMNQVALAARGDDQANAGEVSRPTLVNRIRQLFGLGMHAPRE